MTNEKSSYSVREAADVISSIINPPVAQPAAIDSAEPEPELSELPVSASNTPVKEDAVEIVKTETVATDEAVNESAPATEDEPAALESNTTQVVKDEESDDVPPMEIQSSMLAELLGLEENDLFVEDDSVKVRAKVDGKVEEISLKDLKSGFQLAKTGQKRLEKLSTDKKEFEAARDSTVKDLAEKQQQITYAIKVLEQQYANDWKQVDWSRMREEDPEHYHLYRQDYEDRLKQVQAFKANIEAQTKDLQQKAEKKKEEAWQEGFRKLEDAFTDRLYASAPVWDDAERARLGGWMSKSGFSTESLNKIDDWRVFKWARDSMLREDEIKNAKQAAKKVAKLPKLKVTKPGAKITKVDNKKTKIDEARAKQRKAAKLSGKGTHRKSNLKETTDLIRQIVGS